MTPHEILFDWSRSLLPSLANHLWQATMFSLLAFAASSMLRRGPARARYAIWVVASAKFAVPSALIIFLVGQTGLDLNSVFSSDEQSANPPVISKIAEPLAQPVRSPILSQGSINTTSSPGHNESYCALTVIWGAGLMVLLARWFIRRRRFSEKLKSGRPAGEGREAEALRRVKLKLGIRRRIGLIVSDRVIEPGVWHVLSPVIALPEEMAAHLSDDELEAVMTHEMTHVLRQDNLVSNLQMLLCCLFWFHPLVWLIDRKLYTERECACDERVIELGASAKVYAASLLKVLKFCLGWRMAGVSSATGSSLQRRVNLIMADDINRTVAATHRILIVSVAAAVVILSIGFGIVGHDNALAQIQKTPKAKAVEEDASPSDAKTPRPQRHTLLTAQQEEELARKIEQAPFVRIQFENADTAPLTITDAKIRIIRLDDEEELVTAPVVAMVNNTNQRIVFLRLSLSIGAQARDVVGFRVAIEPHISYLLQPDSRNWSNTVRLGVKKIETKIIGVRFEDGSAWGKMSATDPVLAPPAPGEETPQPTLSAPRAGAGFSTIAPPGPNDRVKYVPARYLNPGGAPLIVMSASTEVILRAENNYSDESGETLLPVVTFANNTYRRITGLKLRFKSSTDEHAVTAFRTLIEPHGSFVYQPKPGWRLSGSAKEMRVQVIGVEFEDGSVWGAMDSHISSRDEWVSIPLTTRKPE